MKNLGKIGLLSGLLLASPAYGDLIIYEGFETPGDYTDGVDLAASTDPTAGTGFTTAWGNTGAANALRGSNGGLNYTDSNGATLATTDGGAFKVGGTRADSYFRSFALTPTPTAGSKLWMSMIFNRDSANKNWGVTLDAGAVNGNGGFGFGEENDTSAPIISAVGANIQGSIGNRVEVGNGSTVFVVGRVTFDATDIGGSPTMDVWVNPDLDDDLASVARGGGDSTITRSYSGSASTESLVIYSHQDNAITFDEIRVGTTLADVVPLVPEPGSLMLALAGSTMLLARRRKA